MKTRLLIASGLFLAAFATASPPAHALTSKECSAKYQAAKAAGTLNGMKWNDFRKAQCAGAEAPAAAPPPAAEKPRAEARTGRRGGKAATHGRWRKTGIARTAGHAKSHARLQCRMENHEGGRQAPCRHEVAAVLARVRSAQESKRNVMCFARRLTLRRLAITSRGLDGRLAQWESTSLTWKGSQVQSLHRPPAFARAARESCRAEALARRRARTHALTARQASFRSRSA